MWIQPSAHGISGISSPVEIQLRGLEGTPWGVNPEFVESTGREEYYQLHLANIKAREEWLKKSRALSYIGVVASEQTRTLYAQAALPLYFSHTLGAFRALLEKHLPIRVLTEYDLEGYSCSAAHSFCYISPYGDVYPCVQFPLPSGNVRRQKFLDIWNHSSQLNEVRSIQTKDLPVCSTCSHAGSCSRCPGLAYMEGNMRGPSSVDCDKSFYRTGIPSANMLRKARSCAVTET